MIKINEEFKKLIPALSDDEFNQLEANCIKDGIRDAICLWNDTIIDGHNRYVIAMKHDLKVNYVDLEFDNENDVIEWMLNNQLGKRNLTKEQKDYLIGKRYENEKQRQGTNNQYSKSEKGQNVPFHTTAEKIAEEVGISDKQVKRNAEYAKGVDKIHSVMGDGVKKGILSGMIKTTKGEIKTISELPDENIKKIIDSAIEKTNQGIKYKSLTSLIKENSKIETIIERENKAIPSGIEIYNGDCIELLNKVKDKSVDCVIIDPPYAIDFNHSWQNTTIQNDDEKTALMLLNNVCEVLQKKAKDDAHFYIFSGWKQIDSFKQIIEKYFDVSNILVWVKNNTSLVDFDKRYAFKYENIFFCKNKGNNERILNNKQSPDVLMFDRVSVPYHPTEKPIELIKYLIENSTVKNEIILDCFMGSGSCGVAALNSNRNFIGIELDTKFYDYAKNRLEQ